MIIRTFVAIKIVPDKNLLQVVNDVFSQFQFEKIKWISTDNFHLTLKFLGKTEVKDIDLIINSLDEIIANFEQFDIEINKFGYFSNKKRPRVFWLGLSDCEILDNLQKKVLSTLDNLDFKSLNYKFRPHITIARIKKPINLSKAQNLTQKYSNQILQKITVKEIVFYESILSSNGAIYKPIHKFELKSQQKSIFLHE